MSGSPRRERSGGRQRSASGGRGGGGGRERDGSPAKRSRSRSGGRQGGRERSRSRSRSRGGRGGGRGGGRDDRRSRSPRPDADKMSLRDEGAVAYLLGRNGTTKQRLANFSGARLEIDPRADGGGTVEIIGSDDERRLARICIDITLQQRNNGKVKVDLEGLRALGEITHFDVDQSAVGFVLGAKGATLRQFEKMYRTFMFFDNDTVVEGGKKRLYILGTRENREKALKECENAVSYKLSGNGAVSSWRERDQPRYDDNYRHNDRGGGGGGNRDRYDDRRDRRRSPSRDRGGGGRYDDRDRRRSRSRSRGRY